MMGKMSKHYCTNCSLYFKVEKEPSYDLATIQEELPFILQKRVRFCPFCGKEEIETEEDPK